MDCIRARALVGTRFRLQGRDPRTGLDCVGLVLEACGLPRDLVRRDYRMRGNHLDEAVRELARTFRRIGRSRARPGDLVLMSVADDQLHFGLLTERGFVHADAGLGLIAERPGTPPWPVLGHFRRRTGRRRGG
jgi:cell wall-associated NlpC family hydrolase